MADGEDVRDLIPDDKRIRLIHLEGGDPLSIGEKRNFGCEQAAGSVIIHWDDDDHSEPHRIQNQITRLMTVGAAVTGYRSMVFTNSQTGDKWLYSGLPDYALGTSLCFKKSFWELNRFPALQVAEDGAFVRRAVQLGQLTNVDACGLITASIHESNTSPRQLSGSAWKRIS